MAGKINIWDSKRDKGSTTLEWTKELVNEIFDTYISQERTATNKQNSVESLSELQLAVVKDIDVKSILSFPSGYDTRWNKNIKSYTQREIDQICTSALKDAERMYSQVVEQHRFNKPLIANNIKIREGIVNLMAKFGIGQTYSVYEYKTPRHRTKEYVTHVSGYLGDLDRQIKTTDRFDQFEKSYTNRIAEIDRWKVERMKELQLQEAENIKQQKLAEDIQRLAVLKVKYETPPTATLNDVLHKILNKNKYLYLAHYLQKNRSDWNDGTHYAEVGLSGFKIENEFDQNIDNEIQCLIDDWGGDGRVFRDCNFNYDVLFAMVNVTDENLMADYNEILNLIN